MAQVTVIDSRKIPGLAPERRGKFDRLITARIDGAALPAFTVILPDETATPDAVAAAIRAEARTIVAHTGTTVTL